MTDIDGQRVWLALLEEELSRRSARVEWQAGEDERAGQLFVAELERMAQNFAATAHLYPVDIGDMSIAEKLACRYFLPEDLQPAGLPTEDQIWAEYQARAARLNRSH
jgi:hypothetical protein